MNINDQIHDYLTSRLEEAKQAFENAETVPLLQSVYQKLSSIDEGKASNQFLSELETNCLHWWTNAEQGIQISEKLYCIYFEHGYLTSQPVTEAVAFGVKSIGTLQAQPEEIDLGGDFETATEFYAMPGVKLDVCSPLFELDYSQLPKEYDEEEKDIEEEEGYDDLLDAYSFTAYRLLHRALREFVETSAYAKLNRKKGFQLLIQDLDLGDAYPLWIEG